MKSGQELYRALVPAYPLDAAAALVADDIPDKETFVSLTQ
jgi:hypothetical protein